MAQKGLISQAKERLINEEKERERFIKEEEEKRLKEEEEKSQVIRVEDIINNNKLEFLKQGDIRERHSTIIPEVIEDISSSYSVVGLPYIDNIGSGQSYKKEIEKEEIEVNDSIEKVVQDTLKKMDLEEKIKMAAEQAKAGADSIKNMSSKIDSISNAIGSITESSKNVCSGIECLKNEMKESKGEIEESKKGYKNVENRLDVFIGDLNKKINELKEPAYICENCGGGNIKELSSYCPDCGAMIPSWLDDSGEPIKGWKPYWERKSLRDIETS